jgi:hypothetical protein
VSTVTTGQTAVALVAGSSIGGASYNFRSASVTANAALAAGAKTYTVTATDTAVRITQAAGGDTLTVRNAANSAQLPLGSVNLGGTNYITTTRDFGASGTASTMAQSGASITIVLGTPSGAVATQASNTTIVWTPIATATDRAGNACLTTVVNEAAPGDIDF